VLSLLFDIVAGALLRERQTESLRSRHRTAAIINRSESLCTDSARLTRTRSYSTVQELIERLIPDAERLILSRGKIKIEAFIEEPRFGTSNGKREGANGENGQPLRS
jgi:hypothetical protein